MSQKFMFCVGGKEFFPILLLIIMEEVMNQEEEVFREKQIVSGL